uniref:NADH dehydrogenase subunit 4L n=1 Tax=Periclimenes brevicarpalis TaxID=390963 RepID=UPI001FA78729|nr:NADH dehydrogenase subunit 4L [Periclimenes brevicarpalis]UMY76337.1 NADH dehydrogenase subunit 4L [Periclimenes brevicarpalis]
MMSGEFFYVLWCVYFVQTFSLMFSIVCGLLAFSSKRKHLLNVLLSLEFVMVSVYMVMVTVLSYNGLDLYFVLFFLSLAACEGALGLSLLVSIVRSCGSDKFSSFSVLEC